MESQGWNSTVSITAVDYVMQHYKEFMGVLNKLITSQGSLLPRVKLGMGDFNPIKGLSLTHTHKNDMIILFRYCALST